MQTWVEGNENWIFCQNNIFTSRQNCEEIIPTSTEETQMYTTQKQSRAAFWRAVKAGEFQPLRVTPKRITDYSGNGKTHTTDTRCAFVDWLDELSKSGEVSAELANRVTL